MYGWFDKIKIQQVSFKKIYHICATYTLAAILVKNVFNMLTHCSLVTPHGIKHLAQYWFRQWSAICSAPGFCLNSLRPRPNRRHFADDIFKCIFENENEWISPRISLKFVSKVRINNIPALVQIMAWRRPGDKPLSEPMMVSWPTHICVTWPQWVNQCWPIVNITLRNKLQWNFHQNKANFNQENAFEDDVCQMAAILLRPHGVKYVK